MRVHRPLNAGHNLGAQHTSPGTRQDPSQQTARDASPAKHHPAPPNFHSYRTYENRYPPQHFLYFFPDPHEHGSFRPGAISRTIGETRISRKRQKP